MFRITLLLLTLWSCSCEQKTSNASLPDQPISKLPADTTEDEVTLNARFTAFDTTVQVVFTDTKSSISDKQRKNYEGFLSKQNEWAPEVLNAVFEFYKKAYPDYRAGWTMTGSLSDKEIEKYLPVPTTAENLKPFIKPSVVHIQDKQHCTEGTLSIEFDCTWDMENGLGVVIENWKVKEAGVAEITYF